MDKAQKAVAIDDLREVFEKSGVVVVSQYIGMTVSDMSGLRARLRKEGAALKVVKNRLAIKALDGKGGDAAARLFKGPIAIAFSPDPVAASKVTTEFAKGNEKFVLIGAVLGETVLNADGVKALATLPSLDQLRAQLIGLLQAPATKVAGVLQAPAGQLARVFSAYAKKDEAA
jgi:large subunit ribosomal protein L10